MTTSSVEDSTPQPKWMELKQAYEKRTGEVLRPVKRRGKNVPHPDCICENCGAPSCYLSINDGKKGNHA